MLRTATGNPSHRLFQGEWHDYRPSCRVCLGARFANRAVTKSLMAGNSGCRSSARGNARAEFDELDETDYFVLKHHQEFGMDYSIVVAETLQIPLDEMHRRHRKLRELGGLKRVEGRIIHYRKNIVKGKWIKHRNHTYYELTPDGKTWIEAFEKLSRETLER